MPVLRHKAWPNTGDRRRGPPGRQCRARLPFQVTPVEPQGRQEATSPRLVCPRLVLPPPPLPSPPQTIFHLTVTRHAILQDHSPLAAAMYAPTACPPAPPMPPTHVRAGKPMSSPLAHQRPHGVRPSRHVQVALAAAAALQACVTSSRRDCPATGLRTPASPAHVPQRLTPFSPPPYPLAWVSVSVTLPLCGHPLARALTWASGPLTLAPGPRGRSAGTRASRGCVPGGSRWRRSPS